MERDPAAVQPHWSRSWSLSNSVLRQQPSAGGRRTCCRFFATTPPCRSRTPASVDRRGRGRCRRLPRGNGLKEINAGMSGLIAAPFMVSLSPPVPLYFALWHVQDEIVGKLTTIAAFQQQASQESTSSSKLPIRQRASAVPAARNERCANPWLTQSCHTGFTCLLTFATNERSRSCGCSSSKAMATCW